MFSPLSKPTEQGEKEGDTDRTEGPKAIGRRGERFRISDCALAQSYEDRRRQGDRPPRDFLCLRRGGKRRGPEQNWSTNCCSDAAFSLGLAQTLRSVGSLCLSLAPQPSELASSKKASCEVSTSEAKEADEEAECDTAEL